jgi:hypothetical protein
VSCTKRLRLFVAPDRPHTVDDAYHFATAKQMTADSQTGKDIAKYLRVSRATLDRYLSDEAA